MVSRAMSRVSVLIAAVGFAAGTVLVGGAAAGAAPAPAVESPAPGLAAFQGTVVDSVGSPVVGACVRATLAGDVMDTSTTGSAGTYILNDLAPGSYALRVTDCQRGVFAPVQRSRSLNSDQVNVENFSLETVGSGYVRATTNPPGPAQISVDGEAADRWGLNWVKVPAGSHELSFGGLSGFTPPQNQNISVTAGQTTVVSGDFAQRGFLRVLTNPAVPSTITVNGSRRNDWGMWTDFPPGDYSVCFGAVAGFDAPGCQNVSVTAGQTATVTGSFTPNASAPGPATHGLLRVTTNPAVPAQVLIDGEIADSWGLTWLKLPPGTHTVSFTDVEGYGTPAPRTVSIEAGATSTAVGQYRRNGSLRVLTDPAVPATVFVDGAPRNDWGLWTDVPSGDHQVCFGEVVGFVPPACATYAVTAGANTTVVGSFVAHHKPQARCRH